MQTASKSQRTDMGLEKNRGAQITLPVKSKNKHSAELQLNPSAQKYLVIYIQIKK